MNENAFLDAYETFLQGGYNGSRDQFKALLESNPNAMNDAFESFRRGGYVRSMQDFQTLIGVTPVELKKKDISTSVEEPMVSDTKTGSLEPSKKMVGERYGTFSDTGEKNTWLEEMVGKNTVTDFFGDMWRAGKQGLAQGATIDDSIKLLAQGSSMSKESLDEFIRVSKELQSVGMSDEMKDFNKIYEKEGGGVLGFIKGVAKNPSVVNQLFISSLSAMFNPTVAAGAATGGVLGAGTGAALGSVGGPLAAVTALGGGLSGLAAGASGTLEAGLSVAEFLQDELNKKGLEFDNEGIKTVLEDDDALQRIRNKSAARGLVIGAIDGITAGVASKVGAAVGRAARVAGRTKAAGRAALAATGIEAVGGGVGEAAARLATGQEMDVAEIGFETITGTVGAPLSAARAIAGIDVKTAAKEFVKPSKYKVNDSEVSREDVEKFVDTMSDEEIAKTKFEVENNDSLKKEIEGRKKKALDTARVLDEVPDNYSVDDKSKLVDLEILREKLSSRTTKTAKDQLKLINDQIEEINKKYAVQEPSAKKVDVQEPSPDSGEVGKRDTKQVEPTEEVAPEKEPTPTEEKVQDEEVITVKDEEVVSLKPLKKHRTAFEKGELSRADKIGILTYASNKKRKGKRLTPFEQRVVDSDTEAYVDVGIRLENREKASLEKKEEVKPVEYDIAEGDIKNISEEDGKTVGTVEISSGNIILDEDVVLAPKKEAPKKEKAPKKESPKKPAPKEEVKTEEEYQEELDRKNRISTIKSAVANEPKLKGYKITKEDKKLADNYKKALKRVYSEGNRPSRGARMMETKGINAIFRKAKKLGFETDRFTSYIQDSEVGSVPSDLLVEKAPRKEAPKKESPKKEAPKEEFGVEVDDDVVYEMNKTDKKIWSKDFEILDNRQGQEEALFDEKGDKTSDKWWIVNKVTGQIINVHTKAMAKDVIANAPAYAEAFGDGTKVEADMIVTPTDLLVEKKEAPKKEAPKKEKAPKKEAPKKEAPKKEAPKKEAPKKEAPKKEAPKKEAPKKEAPKKDVSEEKVIKITSKKYATVEQTKKLISELDKEIAGLQKEIREFILAVQDANTDATLSFATQDGKKLRELITKDVKNFKNKYAASELKKQGIENPTESQISSFLQGIATKKTQITKRQNKRIDYEQQIKNQEKKPDRLKELEDASQERKASKEEVGIAKTEEEKIYEKAEDEIRRLEREKSIEKKQYFDSIKGIKMAPQGVEIALEEIELNYDKLISEANKKADDAVKKLKKAEKDALKKKRPKKEAPKEESKKQKGPKLKGVVNRELLQKQVDRAKRALLNIAPTVNIVIVDDPKTYREIALDNSNGFYDPTDGNIYINASRAIKSTVGHEVFHAILLRNGISDMNARDITKRMVDTLKKSGSLPQGLINQMEAFGNQYVSSEKDAIARFKLMGINNPTKSQINKTLGEMRLIDPVFEEQMAELIGALAGSYKQLSRPQKSIVKRFLDRLAKLFGLKKFTDTEVVDLINTISRSVVFGDVISAEDVAILSVKETDISEISEVTSKRKQIIGENADLTALNLSENLSIAKASGDILSPLQDQIGLSSEIVTDYNEVDELSSRNQIRKQAFGEVDPKFVENNKIKNDDYIMSAALSTDNSFGFLGFDKKLTSMSGEDAINKEINKRLDEIEKNAKNTNEYFLQEFTTRFIEDGLKRAETQSIKDTYEAMLDGNKQVLDAQIDHIQQQQRNSLMGSINYLKEQQEYSPAFKYLMLGLVLRGNTSGDIIVRNDEGDVVKTIPGTKVKRGKKTVGNHEVLSPLVLPDVYSSLNNGSEKHPMVLIKENSDKEFINKRRTEEIIKGRVYKEVPEGTWVRFKESNSKKDIEELKQLSYKVVKFFDKKDDAWCTASGMANTYLPKGDFYLFLDKNLDPKITVRYEGDQIVELKGTGSGQQMLESENILARKTVPEMPNGGGYLYQIDTTDLYYAMKKGKDLSRNQLKIYFQNLNRDLETYNYEKNQEYKELKKEYLEKNKKAAVDFGLYDDIVSDTYGLTELKENTLYLNGVSFNNIILPEGFTIPDDVTFNGSVSFSGATLPEGFTIPDGVTFGGFVDFRRATLPKGFKIGEGVTFNGFVDFSRATLPKGFKIGEGVTFGDNVIFDGATLPEGFTIPDGVTFGDGVTFSGAKLPEGFKIEEGVTFGSYVNFSGVTLPKGFTIPDGVTFGDSVYFDGATLPEGFTIEEGVTFNGDGVSFSAATLPKGFTIPDGVTFNGGVSFDVATLPEGFTIEEGVTFNGDVIFSGAKLPEGFTIPDGVTFGGRVNFDKAKLPKGFKIGEGVTFGDNVRFDEAKLPEGFTIPDDVTFNGSVSFRGSTLPEGFTIPDGVTFGGRVDFSRATLPEGFTIPDDVTFNGSVSFRGATLPDGSLFDYDSSERSVRKQISLEESNLNPEQYDLVRTDEFKNWFGDWESDPENASKIVDENGEPRVVYHGSKQVFEEFDPKKMATETIRSQQGPGYYFTNREKEAGSYGKVISAFMSVKNPFIIKKRGKDISVQQTIDILSKGDYKWFFDSNLEFQTSTKGKGFSRKKLIKLYAEQLHKDGDKAILKNVKRAYTPESYQKLIDNVSETLGVDGVIEEVTNRTDVYVAYQPTQVKMADGSNVTFDPMSRSMRKQKSSYVDVSMLEDMTRDGMTAEYAERGSRVERFLQKVQDKYIKVRRIGKTIEKRTGKKLESVDDFDKAETLYTGRTKEQVSKLEERFEKIIEKFASKGLTRKDVSDYLYAMHAPERNEYILKVDTSNIAGSGMYTDINDKDRAVQELIMTQEEADSIESAQEVIKRLKDEGKIKDLESIASDIRKIQEETLERQFREGLITKETYENLGMTETKLYEHYVPLKGFKDLQSGFSDYLTGEASSTVPIKGKEILRAKGRKTVAGDVLSNIMMDSQTAVIRSNKNGVLIKLLNQLLKNPDDSIYSVYTEKEGAPIGDRKISLQEMRDKTTRDKSSARYFKFVRVVKDGKEYFIDFKDKDMTRVINLTDGEMIGTTMNKIVDSVSKVTNIMRAAFTTMNPGFIPTNYIRDIQTGLMNALAETDMKIADKKKFIKNVSKNSVKALKTISQEERGKTKGVDKELVKYYREFKKNGAVAGYSYVQSEADISKGIDALAEGGKKNETIKSIGKFINAVNTASENSTRLAAYIEARKSGMTAEDAAYMAKNLTVNFNRSGEYNKAINTLYMFFNASVQGTVAFTKAMTTLKKEVNDDGTISTSLNYAQKVAIGIVAFSALMQMLNQGLSDEDEDGESFFDKIPEYEKERNLIIMNPANGKDYFKVPLPYGYNFFFNIGRFGYEVSNKKKSIADVSKDLVNSSVSAFSPISFSASKDVTGSFVKTATPTVAKPFMDLALNENFFKGAIYKENFPGQNKPDSSMGKQNTPEVIKEITKFINRATGGSENVKGFVDVSPETIPYIIQQYTGGAGRFLSQAMNFPSKVAGGELKPREIPMFDRLYGRTSRYSDIDTYNERRDQVKSLEEEIKSGDIKRDMKVYRSAVAMSRLSKKVDKKLNELRDKKKKVAKLDSRSRQTVLLKKIEEREDQLYDAFNKQYLKLFERYSKDRSPALKK